MLTKQIFVTYNLLTVGQASVFRCIFSKIYDQQLSDFSKVDFLKCTQLCNFISEGGGNEYLDICILISNQLCPLSYSLGSASIPDITHTNMIHIPLNSAYMQIKFKIVINKSKLINANI